METIAARILDADYRIHDDLELRLFCVDENRTPFIAVDTEFQPYFYVIPEQDAVDTVIDRLTDLEITDNDETVTVAAATPQEKTDGQDTITAIKTMAALPPHVPKIREHVTEWEEVQETREFDIPFYKRYFIDHNINPTGWITLSGTWEDDRLLLDQPPTATTDQDQDLTWLAFDLEVYKDEIIMCSFYSDNFQKVLVAYEDDFTADYVEEVPDENTLLERLLAIVQEQDPDILLGYNTDEFDFDVLRNRVQEHGRELVMGRTDERMTFQRRGRFSGANLEGRIHLDLYAFVENVVSMGMQSETLSLDAVAEELLGENKEEVSWEDIKKYWRNKEQLDLLATYALRDAELAYKLGESLVPQILSLSVLTGLPPFDVCRHTYGQLVENFLIRQAHQRGILAPNRPSSDERSRRYHEGRYTGGFVYEPEKGLHENIALFDFRSLYPTIIVAHNISPDTLDLADCADELPVTIPESGDTYTFCQDTPGFIPDLLENLVRERYTLKDELTEMDPSSQAFRNRDTRQNALKILSNAFYGYMGYAGARWYSRPSAEATTALGRKYIKETIETAEDLGFEIVYGDTDSIFIKGDDVKNRAQEFQDAINTELPTFMELEFEGFYPRGLFTYTAAGEGAKKKYALIDEEGGIKIVGFEQVRRDWSQIAKETQEQVIRLVLENKVDDAVETVMTTINRLKQGDVPLTKLKIYTQMKKKPENYKSKTPHTEAAKRAIARGEDISPGDTIAYVVTPGTGSISDRTEIVQYADSYDADYYIEHQIIPVAIRVLKVLGYTEDQLLGKGKQTGLDRFG